MASDELSESAEELPESAEVAQASADTGAGPWAKSETGVIDNIHPTQAAEFAWSSEDGTVAYDAATTEPGQSRHRMIMRVGAIGAIVAGAIVVGGGVWVWDHRHITPGTASAAREESAPAANGPVLDGIYEIASDNQHDIVNGVSYSGPDVTRYWAFRSLCTPASLPRTMNCG